MKKLLVFFYVIDICVMLFSLYLLFLEIKAEIEHDELALMGLLGYIQGKVIISSIVSTLVFIVITVVFVKHKKKK